MLFLIGGPSIQRKAVAVELQKRDGLSFWTAFPRDHARRHASRPQARRRRPFAHAARAENSISGGFWLQIRVRRDHENDEATIEARGKPMGPRGAAGSPAAAQAQGQIACGTSGCGELGVGCGRSRRGRRSEVAVVLPLPTPHSPLPALRNAEAFFASACTVGKSGMSASHSSSVETSPVRVHAPRACGSTSTCSTSSAMPARR